MTAWIPLDEITRQEQELRLPTFTHDDAWEIGCALVRVAREQQAPVTIDIRSGDHQLFHAALPGATTEHDSWIARKGRVVDLLGHSTLYVGQECRDAGTSFEERYADLEPELHVAHGGGFPLVLVDGTQVGVLVISGLPQVDDHRLAVAGLRAFLAGA